MFKYFSRYALSRQLLYYAAGPNHIVYTDSSQVATRLLSDGSGYSSANPLLLAGPVAVFENRAFNEYYNGGVGRAPLPAPVAFLHARQRVGGGKRLVYVQYGSAPGLPRGAILFTPTAVATAMSPPLKTPASPELIVLRGGAGEEVLTVFDGQIDPADPSRFTITFELSGQRFTIIGQLRADDTVLLTPPVNVGQTLASSRWRTTLWAPPGATVPAHLR